MTFIHTSTIMNLRGSEMWVLTISKLLAKRGVYVTLVNFDYDKRFPSEGNDYKKKNFIRESLKGVHFIQLRGFRLRSPGSLSKRRGILSSFLYIHSRFIPLSLSLIKAIRNSDLVYFVQCQRDASHILPVLFIATLSGRRPVIAGIHVTPKIGILESLGMKIFCRLGTLRCAHILNQSILEYVRSKYGCTARYVPNGVDTERFVASPKQRDSYMQVLFVGALTEAKGADLLPAIHEKLKEASLPIKVTICTQGGPLRKEIESWVSSTQDIIYLGFVEASAMPEIYRRAHVVLIPSRYEQFPFVPLESQASGTPVIASDLPAIRQCLIEGRTGYLGNAADPVDLARKLIEFYKLYSFNSTKYDEMCKEAAISIREKFSLSTAVSMLVQMFNETMRS